MSKRDSMIERIIEAVIEKGIQIGIEKKAFEVVLNAFDKLIPIPIIANITNLPVEQVMQILKDNQRL